MNEKNIFFISLIAAIAFSIASIIYFVSQKNIALAIANSCISIVWWLVTYQNYKKYKKQKNE